MALPDTEFEAILMDASKRIQGPIAWAEDEDHSPCVEFTARIQSDAGWPLFVKGSCNSLAQTLSFALILKSEGRIYALDMGKDHHNPQCTQVGDTHKHRWREQFRDKEAYAPADITATVSDPRAVWTQFCAEAGITHEGQLDALPIPQGELPL